MTLNETQVSAYRERGYVLIPGLFDEAELAVLNEAVADLGHYDGPEVMREADGRPHVVYGMHRLDERLAALARHPRIVEIATELIGKPIYVHQSRVNVKQYRGAVVDWHQDFGTYHRVDGVPRPDGIMISIFLDDISDLNAPLLVVPGTHQSGIVSEARVNPNAEDASRAAKYRYDISEETLGNLVDRHGLESVTGPRGSVLFLHMNVVHGSTVNITPFRRIILYLNVCATDNRGETFARPEYLAARDFNAIEPLGPDCLTRFA